VVRPVHQRIARLFRLNPREALHRVRQRAGRGIGGEDDDHRQRSAYRYRKHVPRSGYPDRVCVFTPYRDSLTYHFADDLGWSNVVSGELVVDGVPGDHTNMFDDPHVRILAEKLRACMDGARSSKDGQR